MNSFQLRGSRIVFAPEGDPPPGTPPVVPPAADVWTTGLDAEIIGHAQTQGWDKLTPAQAAAAAIKEARANATINGIPAAELVRVPTDRNPEAMRALYERLGRPKDDAGYDFSTVKVGDQPLDAAFTDKVRAIAAAENLPLDVAQRVAAGFAGYQAEVATARATETAAALVEAKGRLAANWGANAEANMFVAKQAAAKLGVDAAGIAALEQVVGYDKVMELFLTVGQKIGEDKFITNGNPAIPGVLSKEQAVAQKKDLMQDTAFTARYLAGDAAAVRQMTALNTLIAGENDSRYAAQ